MGQVLRNLFMSFFTRRTWGTGCLPGSALSMGTRDPRPPEALAQENIISLVQKTPQATVLPGGERAWWWAWTQPEGGVADFPRTLG